jgi:hypothetical protein
MIRYLIQKLYNRIESTVDHGSFMIQGLGCFLLDNVDRLLLLVCFCLLIGLLIILIPYCIILLV